MLPTFSNSKGPTSDRLLTVIDAERVLAIIFYQNKDGVPGHKLSLPDTIY